MMKRPHMAQFHEMCLFLELRVRFAIIYVKFNNHKTTISYSLWKGHGEMKSHLENKTKKLLPISSESKDLTHFKFPTVKGEHV